MRLRQAFEHILDNALRFTPHGGSVSITTQANPGSVAIEVRDTGVGIPADMLPQVMRRFWRRDQAHTTPGFGLGLPIVQKIIDRHNGTLALHSLDNAGTTVTITLPIS
jgi:signal transduction histidine kinase